MSLPALDGDSVHDILVNLPVKSLMRFKCVSKSWQSLIQDSSFAELHLTRSKTHPQLLIKAYDNDSIDFLSPEHGFNGGVALHNVSIPRSQTGCLLKPINGLFCFVDGLNGVTRIFNLSTRQITPWVKTSVDVGTRQVPWVQTSQVATLEQTSLFPFETGPSVTQKPVYGFGFDPSTKNYKVICVWEISRSALEEKVEYICEVLTLGENQWRTIDEVPPVVKLYGAAVYANGSIYWRNSGANSFVRQDDEFIVAFDVGSEKFRVIEIPDYILDFPGSSSRRLGPYLLQIDGHIALVDNVDEGRANEHVVKLWISDDSYKEKKMRANWTEETVLLPFAFVRGEFMYPVDGTNEIVIVSETSLGEVVYVYDRITKSLRKINITGVPCNCDMFIFHESMLPVQNPAEGKLKLTIDDWFKEGKHLMRNNLGVF